MNRTDSNTDVQVYRVYIRATPQVIWDAIIKPEWNQRYGFGGRGEYDLRPGGAYRGFLPDEMPAGAPPDLRASEVGVHGEVIESDPPHRLVLTWWMPMDATLRAEPFTRLTYEIEEGKDGVSKLTVIHDFTGAPQHGAILSGQLEAEGAGGGWNWVLSDLKTLLETGRSFQD